MNFLADMGVAMRIVHWRREEGRDTVHLREENLHRLHNAVYLKKPLRNRESS